MSTKQPEVHSRHGIPYAVTTPNGVFHAIAISRTGDIGYQENAVPPTRALELSSQGEPSFRSAHRAVAKALGWTTKAAEMKVYEGRLGYRMRTYWLPPVDVSTADLPATD